MTGPSTNEAAGAHCAATSSPPASDAANAPESRAPERFDLAIAGMTCGHCVRAVSDVLDELPGVTVDHVRIGQASVRIQAEAVSPAALIEALRAAGYQASFEPWSGPSTDASAVVGAEAKTGLPQAPTSGGCCSAR